MKMQTQHPVLMGMMIFLLSCFSDNAVCASLDALNRNLDDFVSQEMSFVKRIQDARVNLLSDVELEKLHKEDLPIGDVNNWPVLKIRLELLPYKNDGNGLRSYILSNMNSPSALTVIESYAPEYFERRKAVRHAAFSRDHQWLPAIIDLVNIYRGGDLSVSEYGSTALELAQYDSNLSRSILEALCEVYNISTNMNQNVTDSIINKLNEKKWQREYLYYKNRLVAGLIYHSGKGKAALDMYESIVEHKIQKESIYYRVSKINKTLGNNDRAYEVIQEGFQKFPKSSILFMCMAEHKFADRDFSEALKNVDKCLQLTPENPRLHILKAKILTDLKWRHEAMDSCINAIQYSFGWNKEILEQINVVIQKLNNTD